MVITVLKYCVIQYYSIHTLLLLYVVKTGVGVLYSITVLQYCNNVGMDGAIEWTVNKETGCTGYLSQYLFSTMRKGVYI